jgi:hypothetical protein
VFLETHNWGKAASSSRHWASIWSSSPTTTPVSSATTATVPTCSSARSPRINRPRCGSC